MDVCMFSTRSYDRASFEAALHGSAHSFHFVSARLEPHSVPLAQGCEAVCAFVNDDLGDATLRRLAEVGVRHVALRSAGFNHVALATAQELGLSVVRVPAYSPNAVAEHTIALILAANRHIARAHQRVRDHNFSLDGLVGFDLAGKTAGVVGTGRIGALVARLLWHFRCHVLAADPVVDEGLVDLGVEYVALDELWPRCDIVSLNAPLTPATHHLVDGATLARCKPGVMIVNTGRGPLIDTAAVVEGLKSGRVGSLALDVYEEEEALFFEDRSGDILSDDLFALLLTFPNVLITAHQAFLTHEALAAIAGVTLANLDDLAAGRPCANTVRA